MPRVQDTPQGGRAAHRAALPRVARCTSITAASETLGAGSLGMLVGNYTGALPGLIRVGLAKDPTRVVGQQQRSNNRNSG